MFNVDGSWQGASSEVADRATTLKELGNDLFKAGSNKEAIKAYTDGLKECSSTSEMAATLHKNIAACHLKLVRGESVSHLTNLTSLTIPLLCLIVGKLQSCH